MTNTIRKYAADVNHKIVGKLTRRPEWEYLTTYDGEKKHSGYRHYSDEAANEYIINKRCVTIVTADGAVI